MYNPHLARTNMVLSQITPNVTVTQPLYDAMMAIPRHSFVPQHLQKIAYMDKQLALGDERYLMSPMLFAQLTQLAAIKDTDTVLDIGCATGYSTAVFSYLAKKVIALECDGELASIANHNMNSLHVNNSIIISGDLAEGHPEAAPYDVIFINGAVEHIPAALLNQLGENGRLVAVLYKPARYNSLASTVFGEVVVFQRNKDLISKKYVFPAASFPLVNFRTA